MFTRLFRQSRALIAGAMAVLGLSLLPGLAVAQDQPAAPPQPRIAFVAGASNYEKGLLKTSLNDAGLIAETLRGLGFEVYEGADLSQADLMRGIRDFVGRVDAAGPEAWAFVYISGYGTEFEGENYLFGADARFARPSDIPLEAVRLGDLLRPLAAARGRARLVVLDVSRQLPGFDRKLASRGLGLIEPGEGTLLAYSAAPETVAPPDADNENYGAYATALAEMMRAPGLTLDDMFARVRARTHQLTQGRQTPWHATGSLAGFVLDQGDPQAAAPPPPPRVAAAAGRSLREMGPEEAYAMVIERDTLPGYVEYVSLYPDSPYARRVLAIIQVRREALAWWRAVRNNTPQGYWAYLQRYPNGRHAMEASRRLGLLSAPPAPPPGFVTDIYDDLPPPLPVERYDDVIVYEVDAPPPPVFLIAPPAPYWRLPPPPPPRAPGFLPMPRPIAVPGWRPRYHNPAPPPPPVALPVRPGQPGIRPPGPPRGPEGTIAPRPGTTIAPAPGGRLPRPEGRVPPGSRPQPGVVQPGTVQPGGKPAPGTVAPQPGTIAPQPGAKPGTQPSSVQPGAQQPGARPGQPPGVVKPDNGAKPEGRPRPGAAVTPPAGPPPSRNVAPPPSRPTVAPPPPKPTPQTAPPPRATVAPPPPPRATVAPPPRPAPQAAPPPRPTVAAPPPPRPAASPPPPRPTVAAPPPRAAAPPPRPAEGCKPTPQNPNACKR